MEDHTHLSYSTWQLRCYLQYASLLIRLSFAGKDRPQSWASSLLLLTSFQASTARNQQRQLLISNTLMETSHLSHLNIKALN